MKEAMLYDKEDNAEVACRLCSHLCRIPPAGFGICGMRQNLDGVLYTHAYGETIATQVDPVEKKPLYHFLPGSQCLSIATMGCNFRCGFCQNWRISQSSRKKNSQAPALRLTPEALVDRAETVNCRSIAYTYTEPTIFFEYAYETARLAAGKGIRNLFVTNGYMTAEALETAAPFLDACNVDLKSFRDDFYRKTCRGRLQPVLEAIRKMKALGIWLEVTTLLIPGVNDGDEELNGIARFLAETDPDIPWHISRFHPDYEYRDSGITPAPLMKKARRIGEENGLRHVYLGNLPGEPRDTRCPSCGTNLIRRKGYETESSLPADGRCPSCGEAIAGVFG